MKTIIIILAFFVLTGFARHSEPSPVPSVSPSPFTAASPLPIGARIISLQCDDTCTEGERTEVPTIEAKMNQTLRSACFAGYFMDAAHGLDNTNGLNRSQIVAKLREPASLTLNYYSRRFTAAVGYEDADDFSVIHFNRAKLGGWSTCDKASLGAHEFSHTKGFFHNGNAPGPNQNTIPYQTNHAFEDAGCCQ